MGHAGTSGDAAIAGGQGAAPPPPSCRLVPTTGGTRGEAAITGTARGRGGGATAAAPVRGRQRVREEAWEIGWRPSPPRASGPWMDRSWGAPDPSPRGCQGAGIRGRPLTWGGAQRAAERPAVRRGGGHSRVAAWISGRFGRALRRRRSAAARRSEAAALTPPWRGISVDGARRARRQEERCRCGASLVRQFAECTRLKRKCPIDKNGVMQSYLLLGAGRPVATALYSHYSLSPMLSTLYGDRTTRK